MSSRLDGLLNHIAALHRGLTTAAGRPVGTTQPAGTR